MRKILRSIARGRMAKQGITNVNKRLGLKSYFATYWRDYVRR